MNGWRFYVLFNSFSVMLERRVSDDERLFTPCPILSSELLMLSQVVE